MLAVEWPVVRASIRAREASDEICEIPPTPSAKALAALKETVPTVRARVGEQTWSLLIRDTVPRTLQTKDKVASSAYFKMRELCTTCALPMPSFSVHLCESPGGFVQAVHDIVGRHGGWKWLALSRAPDVSQRVLGPALDLLPTHCGSFVECDVLRREAVQGTLANVQADLVTADGAVEMDHGQLEQQHLPLLLAQTEAMAMCLQAGGTFVIKFFEGSRRETQDWIAWISTQFRSTSIVKPVTSRATNSERYLVARGYAPCDAPSATECVVSEQWRASLTRINDCLADDQCKALKRVFARASAPRGV